MKIFLDTEFTDFQDAELISIGMVSEDGHHQIYLEVSDYDVKACNEFVVATVIPMLGNGKQVKKAALQQVLEAWFATLPESIEMCCDSQFDKNLFWDAFAGNWPANISGWFDLYPYLDHPDFARAVSKYHAEVGRAHHALHDAIAHRLGWLAANHKRNVE